MIVFWLQKVSVISFDSDNGVNCDHLSSVSYVHVPMGGKRFRFKEIIVVALRASDPSYILDINKKLWPEKGLELGR